MISERSYPLGYNPNFDGLRAVAALAVVSAHSGFSIWAANTGVDLFFALSGYLITSLLLRAERASLGQFYWRRFLRLFPAMAIVCLAFLFFGSTFDRQINPMPDVVASLLYVSNWTRAFDLGFPVVLAHTWSTSIEEQFYLLWPAVLLVGLTAGGKKTALAVAVVLAIASSVTLLCFGYSGASTQRLLNGFDTRAFGLLIGCAIAIAGVSHRAFRIARLLWLPVALSLWLITYVSSQEPARLAFYLLFTGALTPILVLAASRHEDGLLDTVLSFGPLRYIGRISYGLYLWHVPWLWAASMIANLPSPAATFIAAAGAFACAAASYSFVERPLLSLRERRAPRAVSVYGSPVREPRCRSDHQTPLRND